MFLLTECIVEYFYFEIYVLFINVCVSVREILRERERDLELTPSACL